MDEVRNRLADAVRASARRDSKPAKPASATENTARAEDSVPIGVGPFSELPMEFGRYRIEKLLGKGAMGAVYLGHDAQLGRSVALKVARVSSGGSSKLIKRMETEAKAAARIDHPQICKVFDFGEIDGIRFIAMQYIDGEDLKSYLKRTGRRREPAEAIWLTLQLARALGAAHEKGVIHRDLKPENVMLNRNGSPVIMDFGLARRTTGTTDASLTQGMIVGTAAYMSPEQAIGVASGIDHRSDLYALGVMLFEMLTGSWPFTGSAIEIMGKKCVQEPPSLASQYPEVPSQLAAICQKMIAKSRDDRYASCGELIAALETVDLNENAKIDLESADVTSLLDFPQAPPDAPGWFEQARYRPKPVRNPAGFRTFAQITKWCRGLPVVFRATILVALATCLLLPAGTLFFRNGDALVKVEVNADDVEVTFQNQTLMVADGAHQFKLSPGQQTLHIKSGNVEFDTDKFVLRRGENPIVTVEVVQSEIVTRQGKQIIGRHALSGKPDAAAPTAPQANQRSSPASIKKNATEISADPAQQAPADPRILTGHSNMVWDVAFDPTGNQIVSASADGTVRIWNLATGTVSRQLTTRSDRFRSVAWSPDGKLIAASGGQPKVLVWDAETGREVHELAGHNGEVRRIVFSSDTKTLATASSDTTAKLWDVSTGLELRTFSGHTGILEGVTFHPDGHQLATGSWDKTIRVWDLASGDELKKYESESGILDVNYHPGGRLLAGCGSDLRLWDTSGNEAAKLLEGTRNMGRIWAAVFSPDGNLLACGSDASTITLWNSATCELLAELPGHSDGVLCLAFSPDGSQIASGSGDRNGPSTGLIKVTAIPDRLRTLQTTLAPASKVPVPVKVIDSSPVPSTPPDNSKSSSRLPAFVSGSWTIEDDVLRQSSNRTPALLLFGSAESREIDFSCELWRGTDDVGISLVTCAVDPQNYVYTEIGGFKNTLVDVERVRGRGFQRLAVQRKPVATDRWVAVTVKVRTSAIEVVVDGERVLIAPRNPLDLPAGHVGFRTWNGAARFQKVKVSVPTGETLWDGLPDLN